MKNESLIFKDFGTFINTNRGEQYEINRVVIFKDNQEKIIANYFLDNFTDYQTTIHGDTMRKLRKDLAIADNFLIKSEEQKSWNNRTQYDLYINGDANGYECEGLKLNGERLDINYKINGVSCSQCIGWNNKKSNRIQYRDFKDASSKIALYSIDGAEMEQNIKNTLKAYKQYKKAKELEKTYTANDYKKMSLVSGTDFSDNVLMLKHNGYDVAGLKNEKE